MVTNAAPIAPRETQSSMPIFSMTAPSLTRLTRAGVFGIRFERAAERCISLLVPIARSVSAMQADDIDYSLC